MRFVNVLSRYLLALLASLAVGMSGTKLVAADGCYLVNASRNSVVNDGIALTGTLPTTRLWANDALPAGAGHGTASLIFADGLVYAYATKKVGSEKDARQDHEILCLNADDGTQCWAQSITGTATYRYGGSSTPCVGGGMLFVSGMWRGKATNMVWCFDAKTGEKKWEQAIKVGGMHASPLYVDGKLFINGTGVTALDAKDGRVAWQGAIALAEQASFAYWKDHILACADNAILCYNLAGELVWKQAVQADCKYATPTVNGDLLVLAGSQVVVAQLSEQGAAIISENLPFDKRPGASPINTGTGFILPLPKVGLQHYRLVDGHVQLVWGGGAQKSKGGKKKKKSGSGGLTDYASPVLASGLVFASVQEAKWEYPLALCSIAVHSAEDGRLLGKLAPSEQCSRMSVCVGGGRLFVRGPDGIVCYDLRK